jgi:hypothetical protein
LETADHRLLVEAGLLFTLARLSIRILPFRRTVQVFGLAENPSGAMMDYPVPAEALRPAWAVNVVATKTTSGGTCLAQALAGSSMLGRRGIASTIHLGVAKIPDSEKLSAHAWLRCGDTLVTGSAGSKAFTPVAAFDARPAKAPPVTSVARRLPPGRRRVAAHQGLMQQQELVNVLGALAAGGTSDVVVLKGLPLALRVFGSVAEREMCDIDLLVRPRDAPSALSVLETLGYRKRYSLPYDLKRYQEIALRRQTPLGHFDVDLHWRAFDTGESIEERFVWPHTERFAHQGIQCLVLDRTMTIVHLAYHYAHHEFSVSKILRDFARAWNLWYDEIDLGELLAIARESEHLPRLAVAFARAHEAGLLDVPVPSVRSHRAEVVLHALNGRLGRSQSGRKLIASLLLRPDQTVIWLLRSLFPPPAEMRLMYDEKRSINLVCFYVVRHIEIALRIVRAGAAMPVI